MTKVREFYVRRSGNEFVLWGPMGDPKSPFIGKISSHHNIGAAWDEARARAKSWYDLNPFPAYLPCNTHEYCDRPADHPGDCMNAAEVCMCDAVDAETGERVGWVPCPESLCEIPEHDHDGRKLNALKRIAGDPI